jgi:HAD superfamily hydrolase (TIGR01509 family)
VPARDIGSDAVVVRLPGRFAAAVFDVDGLLVDSERIWAAAEAELLARHGATFGEADRLGTRGRSVDATIAAYARRLGLPALAEPELRAELMDLVRGRYGRDVTARPGAARLLARLDGVMPLAAASSSDREIVELALERTGLRPRFGVVVAADDVAKPKPAPDAYLAACERLGVAPADAVAFEDSPTGVAAAIAAGLTCVGVPDDPGIPLDEATVIIASLADVVVSRRRVGTVCSGMIDAHHKG